jgi:hypothetical protein
LDRKAAEDAERRRSKKEQQEREEREKREKAEKCKAAFEKWKAEAKKRPRTAPNSFGFCAGKLTGFSNFVSLCVEIWKSILI